MKNLLVITQSYPFGVGEDWMDKELAIASTIYEEITILPITKHNETLRETPKNVFVNETLLNLPKAFSNSLLIKNLGLTFKLLTEELFFSKKPIYIVKNLRWFLSLHKKSLAISSVLSDLIREHLKEDVTLYNVWLDEGALAMAHLKSKRTINNFVIRLHGYDLFDERREGNYMPFRYYCFKRAAKVYSLSEAGLTYLNKKGFSGNKYSFNYSGLFDHGMGVFNNSEKFSIVSCSSMFPFKRVSLIAEVLCSLEIPFSWTHFGDGEEFALVQERIKTSKESIQLKGRVPNKDILEFYSKNHVNLFLHLSTTEGLGMAAVEAMSFGIPLMAVDTGGVKEVVNEKTGELLPITADKKYITKAILSFKESNKNTEKFRKQVRKHFLENFEASKNYKQFFNELPSNKIGKQE